MLNKELYLEHNKYGNIQRKVEDLIKKEKLDAMVLSFDTELKC